MTRPYDTGDQYRHGSALSRSFLPLALITLGVFFLLTNLVPGNARGGLIVLGLGAAFLVGRITTGRYGYAMPAGILIAIGLFIIIQDVQSPPQFSGSGLFFILLGLGFGLVYAIGMRPAAIWPLCPAVVLVGLGLVLVGVASLGPLASLSWIAAYWPAALVLLGAWLLFRDSVAPPLRRPIATVGGLALLLYGVVAAAAFVAAGGTMERSGIAASTGPSQFTSTSTADATIAAGQILTVSNTSGSTTFRAGTGDTVHVLATRRFAFAGQGPDVSLTPSSDGLTLTSNVRGRAFPFGGPSAVDYTIDVPPGVGVTVQASSGSIELDGITGEVRATSASGSIRGTALQHVRQVQTSSGSISLGAVFTDPADISAASGSVTIRLLPGSAEQLNVHTVSGSVEPQGGLVLTGGVTNRNTLTGALGNPAPGATLNVQTSSGKVVVSQ